MLQHLTIQNYAIIDSIDIKFPVGMNVVTGETGAGKSIIMGALGLILGDRADSTALVNKEKKSIVEGIFKTENKTTIKTFLKNNDPDNYRDDAEEELVLRREIAVNGKSRAFINDTPVNLDQLRELSSLLVDLHQQFDALQLGENDFQREVIDALAGHNDLINEYQHLYNQWRGLQNELDELKSQKLIFEKEADYNRFQYGELEEASFTENELEKIDTELKALNNAEEIKGALSKVYFELKESESPLVQQLRVLSNQLQGYSSFHSQLPELIQRLQSAQLELQDIAGDLDRISDHISYSPEKIGLLNERLALGYKLLKKHGVKTTAELLDIQKQFEEKLQAVLNIDEIIHQKEKIIVETMHALSLQAKIISDTRHKQVKPLEESVNKLLAQVGMPNAKIKVEIRDKTELNAFGKNSIEFLFDANRSKQFLPVRKVASGGELSRLMLCIKSLVAQKLDMPTLIFDEIDTGISGEAAKQVGIILKELSGNRQVICITHQPQIAGKADAHFFVYKDIVKDEVKTNIRLLNKDERITAIAKMLSGEKPTAAAMENAREIVGN
ncbi:MAG TPA: DNA repair protein RecN [Chitinophagaceae bacterium]|nr:DNA repair protein RecN [Chitinophagaceae bacterium]